MWVGELGQVEWPVGDAVTPRAEELHQSMRPASVRRPVRFHNGGTEALRRVECGSQYIFLGCAEDQTQGPASSHWASRFNGLAGSLSQDTTLSNPPYFSVPLCLRGEILLATKAGETHTQAAIFQVVR